MSLCSSFFLPQAPMDSLGTKMYYVGSAFIPDDHGYGFSVIVLAKNQTDNSALASANKVRVSRFLSTEGLWFCQNTVAAAPVPSRSLIHPSSVLVDKILHFLQPNMQIITVDVDKLSLGSIRFPPFATLYKDNHVLVQTMNDMLSLAVVSTGVIGLTFTPTNQIHAVGHYHLKLQGPGDAINTPVISSARGTLLVRGGVYSMNLTDGCCEEVTTRSNLLRNELVYELEFPPASDILR